MTGGNDLFVRHEDGVLTVFLNRPCWRNALTGLMLEMLAETLADAEKEDSVGCILLTGVTPADASSAAVATSTSLVSIDRRRHTETQRQLLGNIAAQLTNIAKPTLAALPGAIAGANLALALACDMRIAAENTVLAKPLVDLAFSEELKGRLTLSYLIGPLGEARFKKAKHRIEMKEALNLGLVNWVVPSQQLEESAMTIARRLAAGPRITHQLIKGSLSRDFQDRLPDR